MTTHPIIILAGPTASGKSALALDIAKETDVVIINADSKQVYHEIPIITAQPTQEERCQVPHDLYGVLSVAEHCSVASWVDLAKVAIARAWVAGKTPLLVGGTGMYIKSLMEGVSPIPDITPDIRNAARRKLEALGNAQFYKELQQLDPRAAAKLHEGDSQRITRAYEVITQTGKSLLDWQSVAPVPHYAPEQFLLCFLHTDREATYARCNRRFEAMMEQGLMAEMRKLQAMNLDPELPSMRAHGVPEMLAYLNGTMSLEDAIDQSQKNTRHYIKRQYTWFRHQMPNAVRIEGSTPDVARKQLSAAIGKFIG